MELTLRGPARALAVLAAIGLTACGDSGPDNPAEPPLRLVFSPESVSFGEDRSGSAELRNTGTGAAGPVALAALAVRDRSGNEVIGAGLSVSPAEVPTLDAGASQTLTLTLNVPESVGPGDYQVTLEARLAGQAAAALDASFTVVRGDGPPIVTLDVTGGAASARQGEALSFDVSAADDQGRPVVDPPVIWKVEPGFAGLITAGGEFVGYAIGSVQVIAEAGGVADTAHVSITRRGAPSGSFQTEWNQKIGLRYTSDHWEYGDAAYTGTWGCRDVAGGRCGDVLFVWDITVRNAPVLTDSVRVDARTVNDVKVSVDGRLAIITHESSDDGQNGITLLDLGDPHHPTVISRFTAPDLAPGIHNVWIDGDYAYLVVDGSVPNAGLRVLDISDPASPRIVGSFYGGGSFLHDVYVRDGLAFLAHWAAGLIILDIGNGAAGGSPTNPVEVSRLVIPGYSVHNAWYWPASGYVFLGDEIALPGKVLVIDVSDLTNPRQVASFTVAGAAPHNFWIDEAAEIAYFAWYEKGLQAVDVSGRLLGELGKQARQVASIQYDMGGVCLAVSGTCTWAPQMHDGYVYVSDMNSGLWVLRLTF